MRRHLPALCLFIAAFAAAEMRAEKPAHKLKLNVGATFIDVERATPGGEILLIGYELVARDYSRVFRRVEREVVATADGTVRADIGRELATNSFWLTVDLASAHYAAATADGRKLREGELLEGDLLQDAGGRRKKARARFEHVYALLVRGGTAAWQMTVGDGGPLDADGELDGDIEIDAQNFERRGGKKTRDLDEYRGSDLLIVFVPRQMGYVVTQVSR